MRIVNLGSINLDKSYKVAQFATAGKTIRSLGCVQSCGGKGLNQSVALARAGANVWHAGFIGADGESARELLSEAGVHLDNLKMTDGLTGHAMIQVDAQGQNCILVHGGANESVDHAFIDQVLTPLQPGDFLVLQNEVPCVDYAMEQAHTKQLTIFVNPSPIESDSDIRRLYLADYLILNEIEGKILSGASDPDKMLNLLHERYHANIVLTLGADGVCCLTESGAYTHAAYSVETVDTTAAGDTFTGYLIAMLAEKKPMDIALQTACAAAAICVSRRGAATAIPHAQEVLSFLQTIQGSHL